MYSDDDKLRAFHTAHVHGDGIEMGEEMPLARAKRENIGTFSRLRFTIARAKLHSLLATDHAFSKKGKRDPTVKPRHSPSARRG